MDYDLVMGLGPNRVLVVGAGKTGLAVARFCASRNAEVTITDKRGDAELGDAKAALRDYKIHWELGGHVEATFRSADLIVVSPGVPMLPELQAAKRHGAAITGEVELAFRFCEAPVVAVTGTNGKSTVTALAGALAERSGRPTFTGGNLGTPFISCVDGPAARLRGLCVLELSSFQLETCENFHPHAAALLNLTPDHLDRYPSMEAYGQAKLRIGRKMGPGDFLVVNADDEWFSGIVPRALPYATKLWYSAGPARPDTHGFVDGGELVLRLPEASPAAGEERYPIAEMKLVGRHNLGNALAALLLVRGPGLVSYDQARAGLGEFRALPHRMELVGEKRGVRFYDDSKATNVDSVVAGVDGFPAPFWLIAGGRDKGGSYAPLVAALRRGTCRKVLLIGEAAPLIERALDGSGIGALRMSSLEEAVAVAAQAAASGDAVVLSPACSSYDMFRNYEHRGQAFRAAVEAVA